MLKLNANLTEHNARFSLKRNKIERFLCRLTEWIRKSTASLLSFIAICEIEMGSKSDKKVDLSLIFIG